MHADIEQDLDGKLWILVDVPGGGQVRISHEAATADPLADLPPFKFDPEEVKWPGLRPVWFSAGEAIIKPVVL